MIMSMVRVCRSMFMVNVLTVAVTVRVSMAMRARWCVMGFVLGLLGLFRLFVLCSV